jgi:hypothetical protein
MTPYGVTALSSWQSLVASLRSALCSWLLALCPFFVILRGTIARPALNPTEGDIDLASRNLSHQKSG